MVGSQSLAEIEFIFTIDRNIGYSVFCTLTWSSMRAVFSEKCMEYSAPSIVGAMVEVSEITFIVEFSCSCHS